MSVRIGVIRVTCGSLTEEQIIQQLRRLVTANFQWSLIRIDEQVYKVDYPRKEDLIPRKVDYPRKQALALAEYRVVLVSLSLTNGGTRNWWVYLFTGFG